MAHLWDAQQFSAGAESLGRAPKAVASIVGVQQGKRSEQDQVGGIEGGQRAA